MRAASSTLLLLDAREVTGILSQLPIDSRGVQLFTRVEALDELMALRKMGFGIGHRGAV
jgi:hypothetical protein